MGVSNVNMHICTSSIVIFNRMMFLEQQLCLVLANMESVAVVGLGEWSESLY